MRQRCGSSLWEKHSVYPKRLCASQQGAGILRVFYPVEREDERLPSLVERALNALAPGTVLEGPRFREDALVDGSRRALLDLGARDALDADPCLAGELDDLGKGAFGLGPLGDEDPGDRSPGAKGLADGLTT
jgi:hypothetical protein